MCSNTVLTGIHLSSYGREIDGESHLIELIEAIHPIDGISRIRLGSLEPRIIKEEFVGRLKKLHKVCPHFHLVSSCSFSSGIAENQIPEETKAQRSGILSSLESQMTKEFRTKWTGACVKVLLEERQEINGVSYMVGHTPEYIKCAVETDAPDNTIIDADRKSVV